MAKPDRISFAAEKEGILFTFGFIYCQLMLSTCSRVSVTNHSRL